MNWMGGVKHRLNDTKRGDRKLIKEHFERRRRQARHTTSVSREDTVVNQNPQSSKSLDVVNLQHSLAAARNVAPRKKKVNIVDRGKLTALDISLFLSKVKKENIQQRKLEKKGDKEANESIPPPNGCVTLFGEVVPKARKTTPGLTTKSRILSDCLSLTTSLPPTVSLEAPISTRVESNEDLVPPDCGDGKSHTEDEIHNTSQRESCVLIHED